MGQFEKGFFFCDLFVVSQLAKNRFFFLFLIFNFGPRFFKNVKTLYNVFVCEIWPLSIVWEERSEMAIRVGGETTTRMKMEILN